MGGRRAGAGRPKKAAAGDAAGDAKKKDLTDEEQDLLDDLEEDAAEEVEQFRELLLSKEELTDVLSIGFYAASNFVLEKLKREGVTVDQAERWGRVTWKVYHKYLENAAAGPVIHGIVTASILLGKKPLPEPIVVVRGMNDQPKAA